MTGPSFSAASPSISRSARPVTVWSISTSVIWAWPGGPFDQVQLPGEDYPTDFSSNPNENPVIRAIAAEYIVEDGPNEFGDMFERAGRPSDSFPYPFENEQQGRAANGGAYPPDLSVMVKARKGGPEYVRSLLCWAMTMKSPPISKCVRAITSTRTCPVR
jgi:hypothetical protein